MCKTRVFFAHLPNAAVESVKFWNWNFTGAAVMGTQNPVIMPGSGVVTVYLTEEQTQE